MTDPTLLADLGSDVEPGRWTRGQPCTNCGAPLAGPFCSECGQKAIELDPTMGELVHEAAQEITDVDGKLFRSIRALCRPGFLTKEFFEGRRVRYLTPIRLYLMLSVAYFALSAWIPKPKIRLTPPKRANTAQTTAGSGTFIGFSSTGDSARDLAELDSLARVSSFPKNRFYGGVARALRENRDAGAQFAAQFPKAMFVLVPFFGVLLKLAYRRRRIRYPRHLYFAIHYHAFVFLTLIGAAALRLTQFTVIMLVGQLVMFGAWIWYLNAGLQRFYGGRRPITRLRTAAITAVYLPVLFSAMAVVALLALIFLN